MGIVAGVITMVTNDIKHLENLQVMLSVIHRFHHFENHTLCITGRRHPFQNPPSLLLPCLLLTACKWCTSESAGTSEGIRRKETSCLIRKPNWNLTRWNRYKNSNNLSFEMYDEYGIQILWQNYIKFHFRFSDIILKLVHPSCRLIHADIKIVSSCPLVVDRLYRVRFFWTTGSDVYVFLGAYHVSTALSSWYFAIQHFEFAVSIGFVFRLWILSKYLVVCCTYHMYEKV